MKKLFTICFLIAILLNGKAQDLVAFESDEKYGFKNSAGEVVLPALYQYAENFENGLALAVQDNKYGFIDTTGKFIIPNIYDQAVSFIDDMSFVSLNNNVFGIDKNGKKIAVLKYDELEGSIRRSRNLIGVKLNGKLGMIDYKGNEVIPPIYDLIWPRIPSKKLAFVCLDDKMGIIDNNGKLILPIIYDYVTPFFSSINNLRAYKIELKGKSGIVDELGNIILPTIYDRINHKKTKRIEVQLDGKIGYYDFETKKILYISLDKKDELDWINSVDDVEYRLSKIPVVR